ncbi:response regulator transcription factor [Dactylosporangium roseum]|uniref:Response regulator transcription factor n=1 Tax=Dactylosporangium roseum TaxID=47989 RepID=A0ABY5ZBE3_9ACTN|nr:LuxR C-terminal-related transcriptional regulator [Dactylosporangium roseum]UWZ39426.1 response regulator transcription factor [Dactylosporangium roseum]
MSEHPGQPDHPGRVVKARFTGLAPIMTYGLTGLLGSDPRFQVLGEAGPSAAADVLLRGCLDACADGGITTEPCRSIPTLVVGNSSDRTVVDAWVGAGALGYVGVGVELPTIVDAALSVAAGCRFIAVGSPGGGPSLEMGADALSPRERQVLTCIALGRTHSQVARILGISAHTVDTYVKRARGKLGLGNKADLTRAVLTGPSTTGPALRG